MRFVAIDFETANAKYYSACSVGIVTIEDGKVIDEYYTLIKPPHNKYDWMTTRVHGIKAKDTANSPTFPEILPEIVKRLKGQTIVAHNEMFDRGVLRKTALYYKVEIQEMDLNKAWECTVKICHGKGHKKANLTSSRSTNLIHPILCYKSVNTFT